MQCTVAQLAASKAELGSLQSAREKLARELELLKGENKALLQRSALADSLSAEADALRQQVTAPWNYYQSLQGSSSRVSRGFCRCCRCQTGVTRELSYAVTHAPSKSIKA